MNETKPTANAATTVVPTCPAARAPTVRVLRVVAAEVGLEAGGFARVCRCGGRCCRARAAATPAQGGEGDRDYAQDQRRRRHQVGGEADALRLRGGEYAV